MLFMDGDHLQKRRRNLRNSCTGEYIYLNGDFNRLLAILHRFQVIFYFTQP
jgi:hypothetical protein